MMASADRLPYEDAPVDAAGCAWGPSLLNSAAMLQHSTAEDAVYQGTDACAHYQLNQALHTQQPMETGQAYANAQPGSSCSMHSSGGADQWMQAGGGLPQGFGLRAAAAKRRSGNASEMSQYSTYETLSPPITETAVPHYPTVSPPQSGPAAAPACLDPRIELANHLSEYELREISEWYPAVYYVGQHAQKGARDASGPNFGFDTEDTHYRIVPGDHIAYRYEIVGLLGTGTFAQVLKCYDHKRDRLVAVKVIRNELRFHRQAATECRILECLAENHWTVGKYCVQLYSHFKFRGHVCIVTELLSCNLYQLMDMNNFACLGDLLLRRLAQQLLLALAQTCRLGIMHCDVKPENVLLCSLTSSTLKLADFGSSCFAGDMTSSYIQSRLYRSPEVILGLQYTPAIDMWSFGVMLAELHLGSPLFPGKDEHQMLQIFEAVVGAPDYSLVAAARRCSHFVNAQGRWLTGNSGPVPNLAVHLPLYQALKGADPGMIDLIERCLQWDPAVRITASEALQHPWVCSGPHAEPSARKHFA